MLGLIGSQHLNESIAFFMEAAMNSRDILSHPYRNSLIGFGLLMGSIPAHASTTYQFETSPVSVGVGVDENAVTDKKGSLVTPEAPIFIGDKLSASLTLTS